MVSKKAEQMVDLKEQRMVAKWGILKVESKVDNLVGTSAAPRDIPTEMLPVDSTAVQTVAN